jgi:hypothetical protein
LADAGGRQSFVNRSWGTEALGTGQKVPEEKGLGGKNSDFAGLPARYFRSLMDASLTILRRKQGS